MLNKIGSAIFSFVLLSALVLGCTSEFDQMIAVCEEELPEYITNIDDIHQRWNDALDIAISTSRISLAGPISDLQEIRREAETLNAPECISTEHQSFINAMNSFIELFLEFASNSDTEPDDLEITLAYLQIDTMGNIIDGYQADPEAFMVTFKEAAAAATVTAQPSDE